MNQGQTMHHFILIQLDRDDQVEIKVNLTQEEIDSRYNGKFDQKITGPLFNVLAQLLQQTRATQSEHPNCLKYIMEWLCG